MQRSYSTTVRVFCPQVTPLNTVMTAASSASPPKIVKHSTADPVLYLDRLSAVFRHVQPSNGCPPGGTAHPCKAVVEGLWPVLSRGLHLYQVTDSYRHLEWPPVAHFPPPAHRTTCG